MGFWQDFLPLEMPSGGMRALRGLGFEAIRAFLWLFQAADKQSAKWISSRAGFETYCNSAGEMAFWPERRLRGSGLGDTQHLRAGAGRKMLSQDIRGYFQTIRRQLVVLQIEQAALIARANEYLRQRVSVCSPCPPFP